MSDKKWRPIDELHEDFGLCLLIDIRDPGGVIVGSVLDDDFDESTWTHFHELPELSNADADRMIAELPK